MFKNIKNLLIRKKNINKIELRIAGISYSKIQNIYVLILEEIISDWNDPNKPPINARKVPININFLEAQSIAVEIEKIKLSTPLIYDFIKNLTIIYKLKFKEIDITEIRDGELFTKIICDNREK